MKASRESFKWISKEVYDGKIIAMSGGIQFSVTANNY